MDEQQQQQSRKQQKQQQQQQQHPTLQRRGSAALVFGFLEEARRKFKLTEEEISSQYKAIVKEDKKPARFTNKADFLTLRKGEEVAVVR